MPPGAAGRQQATRETGSARTGRVGHGRRGESPVDALSSRRLRFASLDRRAPPSTATLEANKPEAERSLAIAKAALAEGNPDKALRFTRKSLALFETRPALAFLDLLEKTPKPSSASTSGASAGASGASAAGAGARQRSNAASSSASTSSTKPSAEPPKPARAHTPVQLALVKKIRSYQVHEYYKILDVEKDVDDAGVKKGYKKVRSASAGSSADLV